MNFKMDKRQVNFATHLSLNSKQTNTNRLAYSQKWEEEDKRENLSDEKRTMNVVKNIMNSIYRNIKVDVEVPENFKDAKLPVLDFKCWVENKSDGGREIKPRTKKLLYTYFEKEMSTKYSILKTSAMPENTKINSLSNDMIRRMKNTSELLDQKVRNSVVDKYAERLLHSGYKRDQVRNVVEAGLKGYEKIVQLAKLGKTKIHRDAGSSLNVRYKKKLTGKSTWFLNKKVNSEHSDDEEDHTSNNNRQSGARKPPGPKPAACDEATTVLFVPYTPGGELASRLKSAELELRDLCGNKVKIIERAGVSLKQILVKTNPWSDLKCGRPKCLICQSGDKAGYCKARGITYMTSCLQCKANGIERHYVGESARSGYERGREHLYDYETESKQNESHMFKHFSIEHQNDEKPEFSMKVIKTHQSALNRQIHEAILILSNESVIINSRGEYNRCQLPRLSVMMGESEVVKKDKLDKDSDLEDLDISLNNSKRKEPPTFTMKMRKRRKKNEIPKGTVVRTPDKTIGKFNQDHRTPKRMREEEGNEEKKEREAKVARKELEVKSIPAGSYSFTAKPAKSIIRKKTSCFNSRSEFFQPKINSTKNLIEFFENVTTATKPKSIPSSACLNSQPLEENSTCKMKQHPSKSAPTLPPNPARAQPKCSSKAKQATQAKKSRIKIGQAEGKSNQKKISNYFLKK